MEKKQLTIVVLALAIIGGIIFIPKLLNPMKDCGNDENCFKEAVKTCERAKMTYSQTDQQGTFEFYAESRGMKGADCLFYFRVATARFELAEEPETEVERNLVETLQGLFRELEGKAMTCKIPKEQAAGTVGSTGISSAESQKEYCTGPLVGAFEALTEAIQEAIEEAMQQYQ